MLSGLLLSSERGYAIQKMTPPADSTKKAKVVPETYSSKPSEANKTNNGLLQIMYAPFNISSKNESEDDKILNGVIIYPNPVPVSEQLNLTYKLNKDSNVTIKLMDVLGNEITTFLPSEHKSAGEWSNSFPIPSRLNSGMSYFIEVIAGKEIVVKRISII